MGDQWPLLVESGMVGCDAGGRPYFDAPDGKRYGLTGAATQVWEEIDPIWADSPAHSGKASLSPLTTIAQGLCE